MSSINCGRFIAELRKEKRITQTELADLLKVSNSAISRWETGEGFPDISIFPRLAEILNVSVDELLKGKRNEKERKTSLKFVNRRFRNSSFGSLVMLISSFFIFVAITYSTYRVWYGVIAFIVLSTISVIWFIFGRNEMIYESDYTDDDKHQIYKKTLIFYSLLIVLFIMLIPQMIATTQSNITTTVMSLDYYLFWIVLIGGVAICVIFILNIIYSKKIHQHIHKINNQDSIVVLVMLIYIIIGVVFGRVTQLFGLSLPVVVFTAISFYLYTSKTESKNYFIFRLTAPLILVIILLIRVITPYTLNSGFPNIIIEVLLHIILLYMIFIFIFSLVGIVKKIIKKEYDNYLRMYRQFILLEVSIMVIAPFTLPLNNIIVSLSISIVGFIFVDRLIEKKTKTISLSS